MNQENKPEDLDQASYEYMANGFTEIKSHRQSFKAGAIWQASRYIHTEQKWINIVDEMPITECMLLTTSKKILIGDWYDGIWRVSGKIRWVEKLEGGFKLLSDLNTGDVTHWMPFPKSPTEQKGITIRDTPPTYTQEQMIAFGEAILKEAADRATAYTYLYEHECRKDILNIDISKLLKTT